MKAELKTELLRRIERSFRDTFAVMMPQRKQVFRAGYKCGYNAALRDMARGKAEKITL